MTDGYTNTCIVCGKPSMGVRCRTHHGEYIRDQTLIETAERDRELLAMVNTEHLSGQRLADRLGVSKMRALQKKELAFAREEKRKRLGIAV